MDDLFWRNKTTSDSPHQVLNILSPIILSSILECMRRYVSAQKLKHLGITIRNMRYFRASQRSNRSRDHPSLTFNQLPAATALCIRSRGLSDLASPKCHCPTDKVAGREIYVCTYMYGITAPFHSMKGMRCRHYCREAASDMCVRA